LKFKVQALPSEASAEEGFKVQSSSFALRSFSGGGVQALPSEASAEEGFKVLSSVFCSWQMAAKKNGH
jgi:hypothetical protein